MASEAFSLQVFFRLLASCFWAFVVTTCSWIRQEKFQETLHLGNQHIVPEFVHKAWSVLLMQNSLRQAKEASESSLLLGWTNNIQQPWLHVMCSCWLCCCLARLDMGNRLIDQLQLQQQYFGIMWFNCTHVDLYAYVHAQDQRQAVWSWRFKKEDAWHNFWSTSPTQGCLLGKEI